LWRLMFGSSNSGDCDRMTELWYGGFPFVMGYPQIIQVMDDHDLVLKPMVTWGSPILGHLHMFGN
jgi:hypothetical protein